MKVERIVPVPLDKKRGAAYAARAAETQLGVGVKDTVYLGGGSFGRAYRADLADGRRIVVKLLRAGDMMEKEAHDLRLLRTHCPVKVPEVLFERRAGGDIPVDCYGMERIEGKNALMSLGMLVMSRARRQAFADEVTDALHEVHKCTSPTFGDTMSPGCSSWLGYYGPFARAVLDKAEEMHAAGRLSGKIIFAMRAAWDKYPLIFSEKVTEACLVHGDLNVANIMVDGSYRVTGFIDPLNSMYADREYDLFQFDNLTGKRFRLSETYRRKYGESRYCAQKLAFYGLWNEVYCYIKSGVLVGLIMNPLVKNMHRRLAEL